MHLICALDPAAKFAHVLSVAVWFIGGVAGAAGD
jgi:hypothetical protein